MTGEPLIRWRIGNLSPGVNAIVSIPSASTKPSGKIGAEIFGIFLEPLNLSNTDLRRVGVVEGATDGSGFLAVMMGADIFGAVLPLELVFLFSCGLPMVDIGVEIGNRDVRTFGSKVVGCSTDGTGST